MQRLLRCLRQPIPLDFGTVVFCFLEGATLSIPAALLLLPINPLEPPETVSTICAGTAMISSFLLPLWSWAVLGKKEKGLAAFGLVSGLTIVLGGLLFPALAT